MEDPNKQLYNAARKKIKDINDQLYYAARYGQINELIAALEQGADPNTNKFPTPILIAAMGYALFDKKITFDMAKRLLDKGANVNAIDTGYFGGTALHPAATFGDKDTVLLLLERGADKTIKDKSGRTAQEYARDPDVIKIFDPSSFTFREININKEAGITSEIPGIKPVQSTINVSDNTTHHDTDLYQDTSLDFGWFKKQHDFLASLSESERTLLRSYTRNGDEIVGALYRYPPKEVEPKLLEIVEVLKTPYKDGTPRPNIFAPVPLESIQAGNVIPYSVKYVEKLIKIFEKAPPIEKPLRVARAIKLDDPSTKINPLSGITSTTYALVGPTLVGFMNIYEDEQRKRVFQDLNPEACCVFDMLLQPGVRAIWLAPISHFPGEHEIAVLPSTIQVSFSHPTLKKYHGTVSSARTYDTLTYDAIVRPITGKTFSMKGGKTRKHKTKRRRTIRRR